MAIETESEYRTLTRKIADSDSDITYKGRIVIIDDTGETFECSSKAKVKWYLLDLNPLPYGVRLEKSPLDPTSSPLDLRKKDFIYD